MPISYGIIPEVRSLTIGSVRIDSNDECPISYMCNETGIGSGTIHYEEKLFLDRLDAFKYATEKDVYFAIEQNNEDRRIREPCKERSKRNLIRRK